VQTNTNCTLKLLKQCPRIARGGDTEGRDDSREARDKGENTAQKGECTVQGMGWHTDIWPASGDLKLAGE
jgi:hypothetical protein